MRIFAIGLTALLFILQAIIPLSSATETSIELQLSEMTLAQKVAQMFMVSFFTTQLADVETAFLREVQPGAVVLFARNYASPGQLTELTNAMQRAITDAGGSPLLIAVDHEGGAIQHLREGFTRFPAPMLLTATQNSQLAYEVGAAVATELGAVGVNMNLAPVADLNTNPDNPIIGRRAFGDDPELVAPILTQFIRGMQDNSVVATAKHFPGHGDTGTDSHHELPVVTLAPERIRSIELRPFAAAVEADVDTVMVGHIWLSAFDAKPRPASLSERIVSGLLREELGFDGVIMTDALDMDAIDTAYSLSEAAVLAIAAGNDLIAIGAHVSTERIRQVINDVVDAARDGRIAEERIDASVRRILALKNRQGIMDWQELEPLTVERRMNQAGHDLLVTRIFEKGVTLVGETDRIPIRENALIVYPATRPRIRSECDDPTGRREYVGVSDSPQDEEIAWVRDAVDDAETIVVFTHNARRNARQQQLLNLLPAERAVLVSLWDSADILAYADAAAYILGYSPMARATAVICDILLGRREALGSLPTGYAN